MLKRFLACVAMAGMLVFSASSVSTVTVEASSIEDTLGGSGGFFNQGSVDSEDAAIGDWIGGQRGMTSENLNTASKTLSPLTSIMGNIVGGIIVIVFAYMFVQTALDLLYFAVPPLRNILYKGGAASGVAGGGMPMGGGFGRSMMGGFGMAGGGNPGMAAEARPTQWISDEAVQCAAMLNNGGTAGQPMIAGGMMAGGMQAGAMATQQSGANVSMKSVIAMYFKKRAFFMIILAMCAIVLTSSVLLGTGVNLANWVTKILSAVNNNIPK